MPRTLENKKAIVADLKQNLSESQAIVVIDYKGLSVAEITDLRNRLRESNAVCQVTKNTLMKRAIEGDENWQAMEELLQESSAFLFLKDDLGSPIKAYQEFKKATKKTELRGGVLEGKLLREEDVKAIGELPSKEQLIGQIAGAINALATKIAVGIKEVPSSIARGLKAHAEPEGQPEEGEAA